MSASERIKKINDYFHEMKVVTGDDGETVIYVSVQFPHHWIVDNKTNEKFNVQTASEAGLIFFWADINDGEDIVFDAIDYNIGQNIAAQEKMALYNAKVEELGNIFKDENNTLEMLRELQIVIPKQKFQLLQKGNNETKAVDITNIDEKSNKKDKKK